MERADMDIELTGEQQKAIVGQFQKIGQDPHRVLGVSYYAPLVVYEDAYRALAMKFHPDRFHSKKIGEYVHTLQEIFISLTTALDGARKYAK